jgi:nucleoside-diphosphate-sugar epimerase
MKVFLTGGSGYIGQTTIVQLIKAGHAVEALARSESAEAAVTAIGATVVRGGLEHLDVLNHAAANAEAVIHLAQATSGEQDLAAASAMQDGVGGGTYVHTGGSWVYGNTKGVGDESAPWDPPQIVAWRKAVEDAVLARAADGGRPVIIRPGLLYGGDNRLIEHFFVQPGKAAGAVPYIGDGNNHWALVHVDDLAELYIASLSALAGSVYIGTCGADPTAKEVAGACARAIGLDGTTASITLKLAREQMGPIADAFALDQRFSPSKAMRELGWAPAHTDPLRILSERR